MDFSNLTNQDFQTLGAIGAYIFGAGSVIAAAAQTINVRSMRKLVKEERGARASAEGLTAALETQIAVEQEKSSAFETLNDALNAQIRAKDNLIEVLQNKNAAVSELADSHMRSIRLKDTSIKALEKRVDTLIERNGNQAATIKEYADKAAERRAKLSAAGRKGALVANPKRKKVKKGYIDYAKPIEYVDGQKATFIKKIETAEGKMVHMVTAPGFPKSETGNFYDDDGTHRYGQWPSIRNVSPRRKKASA